MKISRLLPSAMATMTLVVGACFIVNGQDTTMNSNNMQSDAAFVQKNIRDNQHEVEMSQMALDKSGNQKIKNLAQQMVKDHTKMLQDLQKLEGNVSDSSNDNAANSGNMSQPGDTGTASNQPDMAGRKTSRTDDSSGVSSSDDSSSNGSSSIMQDSSMRGTDTQNSDMQGNDGHGGMHDNMMMNATGKEFDDMWVSHMLDAHNAKLDELKIAAGSINNPELKTLVEQAIPKVKMHRDRLQQMSKNASGKSGSSKMKSGS